jgi:hypothetical protein
MVKNLALLLLTCIGVQALAQKRCSNEQYIKQQLEVDPALKNSMDQVEVFTQSRISSANETQQRIQPLADIIKIPVVFHILYHTPDQNMPMEAIDRLMNALNRDFNKRNFDTINIPPAFRSLATSMGFEFRLATQDPQGASTTGVIKKYTPIKYWMSDDKMKFNTTYGDDAWDSKSYLNIWLCNMQDVLGYSTLPGMDPKKDGVVLSLDDVTNARGTSPHLNDFRTMVHEVGHWLNLYHLWGDGYCGDDKVDDTPKQSTYTPGCPSGTRISCVTNNTGDMYMNFMDFTDDICMHMFTKGQTKRARALFEPGGPRRSILNSKGLNKSEIPGVENPDFYPKWLHAHIYPNPATSSINVYFDYDERWIGKELKIMDMTGRLVLNVVVNSRIQRIDLSSLKSGVYFIYAKREEDILKAKFVKL